MKNELTFKDHDRGFDVARSLLNESYVVMLSYEEDLLILNYEFSEHGADRNDVVLMSRDEYDTLEDKLCDDIFTDLRKDIKRGRITDVSQI